MKVCFHYSEQPRERILAEAVVGGIKRHGDIAWAIPKTLEPSEDVLNSADVHAMIGVKSRNIFYAAMRLGAHVLYFDKGYLRHVLPSGPRTWEYWRVCLDAQHPTAYLLDREYPSDRFDSWKRNLAPWRADGKHIIIAGSSEKYHAFYDLPHPTEWATKIIRKLSKEMGCQRPLVYRPKPSWRAAVPIKGATFSADRELIGSVLKNAWCLVTHGSNAALDAILAGVPAIVLGDGVARSISSTELDDIESPRMVSLPQRAAWANAIAYQQFTVQEMFRGQMWDQLRPLIYG